MSDVVRNITRRDDAVIVEPEGEITIEESPGFHKSLLEICRETPTRLIVDLHQVSYMDSSGVGTLVDAYRKLGDNGGKMALVGLTPAVRSVFEITRLDRFFPIYDSVDEALKA